MKPVIPLTLIAFCLTLVVGTLTSPFNTTVQVGAVAFSTDSGTREIARDGALANVISFKQSTIQTKEGDRVKVILTSSGPIQETTRVKVKIIGGTAKNGVDYRLSPAQTITFYKGGLREKSFLIPTLTDKINEQSETIILSLYSSTDQSLDKKTTINIGNGAVSPTTPPSTGASAVAQQVNLNAIPTDTSLDTNGWPKYLKVPATCAKPIAGKRYIFEPRFGRHPTDNFSDKFVAPLLTSGFGGSSGEFVINKTSDEVFAIPFYAPYLASVSETVKLKADMARLGDIAMGNATQYWAPHAAYGNEIQMSISKCPGGENPIVSTGAGGYGTLVTGITVDGEKTRTANGGNLNQGGYYFLNISGPCERDFSDPTYTTGIYARNGKPLCASITQSYGSYSATSIPPYTGPALSKGPYPINYNYKIVSASAPNSYPGNEAMRWRCFDVTGKGPEMRYEITSRGWTEPNKPSYSNYVCAAYGSTESRPASFEDVPVYRVCAKHSVGYTRTSRVSLFSIPLQHIDTCQFDTVKGVYYWKTTTASNSTLQLLDQATPIGAFNFTTAWNSTPGTVEYKDASGTLIKSERFH